MVNVELRSELPEGALVFDNPSFDRSIIGTSHDDRVVYSFDRMVKELMDENEGMSECGAIEFIDRYTIRLLEYFQNCAGLAPIILFKTGFEEKI